MNSIEGIHNKVQQCTGVSIDSRSIKKGNCFIAIKGPNFNGNDYAKTALENGAKMAIVDDPNVATSNQYVLVDNGLITLQQLAKFHRLQYPNLKLVVIAGSNGKTTTKELTSAVLSESLNVISTKGNLNNHIGVPLTLLEINGNHDIAIVEIGANHIGEHEILCELAKPNYGIVTNCGKDHLSGYGSIDGVIQSNKEVYDYLLKSNGKVFISSDDPTLLGMADGLECIYYGLNKKIKNQLNIKLTNSYPTLTLTAMTQSSAVEIPSNLYGQFNLPNIMAALTIGDYFDVPLQQMKTAISSYQATNNRSQQLKWEGVLVYLDAYNANPSSMKEFCNYISDFKTNEKIIILGAMEELGKDSDKEHRALIKQVSEIKYLNLFLVGDQFKNLDVKIPCHFCESFQEVRDSLTPALTPNSAIFVKGSRKYTLEKIFDL